MTTRCLILCGVLLGGLGGLGSATAQEEDDHSMRRSGSDPATENRPDLRAAEPDATAAMQDTDKTFGVGYGQTVGGVTGIEIEYYLGAIMLNAHAGFLLFSPDPGDSLSAFQVAGGVFYRLRLAENVALMLGGRVGFGQVSAPTGTGGLGKLPQQQPSYGDTTQFNIEVPLRVQLYFADIIGVHAEVGPVLAFVGEGGGVLGDFRGESEGVYLQLPTTNLLASFGVVIYTN